MQYQNGIHPYEHALPAFGNRFRIRRYPPLPSRIGQYRLTRTLGSGAFGVVKEGVHRRTGEKVAIKLIRKEEIGHRPGFYTEIEREIEILEELDHGNIIKFKGVCQTEDHIAIVLEYVGGGELYSYLLHCGRFDEGHARLLFSQIVSGVQYMHRKNIVHRDLKMENILMVDSRHLKIADFGLAKRFCPGNDMSQTRCGTALYAAPEQYLANRVYASLPADIWSCGVILYTMVCGHTPFQDDAADDTGRRLYQRIRAAPLIFPTFVSRELQDLIRRMLVVNPSRRCTIEDVVQHPWL
ncbi:kinase-like domain-containing protein, partial [Dichotomocladium elegans]